MDSFLSFTWIVLGESTLASDSIYETLEWKHKWFTCGGSGIMYSMMLLYKVTHSRFLLIHSQNKNKNKDNITAFD